MQPSLLPFNLDLLIVDNETVKNIRPIKVLDIYDGFSRNFHPDGLFSTDTFGKVGEERRNRLFSYIDLRVEIFHPIIYKALSDLKSLYAEIISGKTYAIFDSTTNDFEKSDPVSGETGYSFFSKHFKDLKFENRPSPKREFNIKLVNKYREKSMFSKLVVLPAGLRDLTIDENGKPSEDEINKQYREVLAIANMLSDINVKINDSHIDQHRYNIQLKVNGIYDYIKNLLEGKSKLVQGKWASRKIMNSTRNVITSYVPESQELFGITSVSANETVVGLYQYLRAILPLAIKHVRDGFLSNIFIGPNSPAILVNKKTLKKEAVTLDAEYYDNWMTYEGLEKTFAEYGHEDTRHDVLMTDSHYFGLLYKGKDMTYRFMQDIDELPEGFNKEDITPITLTELLYLSVYKGSDKIPGLVTRYPITGYGSIYPSYIYLKSTVKSEVRKELGDDWQPTGIVAKSFPIINEKDYNSMSPHTKNLKRLTADFDR